ncbi:unnamed protein product, partial [Effrenium voratum]
GGGGGGDDWGHGNARPMLRLRRSSLLLASAVVSDGGKGLAAEESRVSLKDVVLARLALGAELHGCCLEALRCHVSQLPRWGAHRPKVQDDDNDGFYIRESASSSCRGMSYIQDSVFADGADDAVDH